MFVWRKWLTSKCYYTSVISFSILYGFLLSLFTDSPISIECSHMFDLNLNLAQILDLNVSTNIRVINSYTSEVFIKSPCCTNITISSNGTKCSLCSKNGIKVCNLSEEMFQIGSIQNAECESRSTINLSCTSRVCPPRNNTEGAEVFIPGEGTGCLMNNRTYTCSKYGNWTDTNCTYGGKIISILEYVLLRQIVLDKSIVRHVYHLSA